MNTAGIVACQVLEVFGVLVILGVAFTFGRWWE